MPINRNTWLIFILLSVISLGFFALLTYPQLSFINLSIDRQQAIELAKDYLQKKGTDDRPFKVAAVLSFDNFH